MTKILNIPQSDIEEIVGELQNDIDIETHICDVAIRDRDDFAYDIAHDKREILRSKQGILSMLLNKYGDY